MTTAQTTLPPPTTSKYGSEFAAPNSVNDALGFDSEHLLRSENIPFDIDNWYPSLKKWTFRTVGERFRERQTDRQTDRQTERERERLSCVCDNVRV